MDGGLLCICDICCSEDASETSENSPLQTPSHDSEQRNEDLDEEYNQRCTSLIETEEDGEKLKQTLNRGDDFSQNEFRQVEKRKFGRISDDACEVTGTKIEEMERLAERCKFCMKRMSTGELSSGSCSDCEIDDDDNDLREVDSVEQED